MDSGISAAATAWLLNSAALALNLTQQALTGNHTHTRETAGALMKLTAPAPAEWATTHSRSPAAAVQLR
eukprot:COSAG02_NODE_17455_length_1002_cov_0.899225_1_plen_69_part_00